MTSALIPLGALAAVLGVAPAVLRTTFQRAGVALGPRERASVSDLTRMFGSEAARELLERIAARQRGARR
jgi:hypothetical protein